MHTAHTPEAEKVKQTGEAERADRAGQLQQDSQGGQTAGQWPRVAFIGLGNMGGPMAANLVAAGVPVTAFDLVPEALERARQAGVPVAADAAEAVAGASVVLTMLPAGEHVISAYTGKPIGNTEHESETEHDGEPQGLLAAAQPGATFLDCSTINIAQAQQAAQLAREAGFDAADAPVSGGVVGAEAGTLAFMVGAEDEVFARVQPLLEVMGARVVHCGGSGLGQAAKICNNMILGVSMIAVSEAFVLAEHLGLSHQAMFDVVSQASGQCWALTTNCPVPGPVPTSPAGRDYRPGFAGGLMVKDLGLAMNAVEDHGVHAQLGAMAAEIYREFAQGEQAGQDFSAVIHRIREQSSGSGAGPKNTV